MSYQTDFCYKISSNQKKHVKLIILSHVIYGRPQEDDSKDDFDVGGGMYGVCTFALDWKFVRLGDDDDECSKLWKRENLRLKNGKSWMESKIVKA